MAVQKKIVFMVAGAITLVVIAGILVLLLDLQAFKPRIEKAASHALEMDVRIRGRVGIALVPVIGVSLKDITVKNGDAAVAAIEKMTIGLKLIPLLRREVLIDRVTLIGPVVSITRDRKGTFNFERPGRRRSGTPLAVEKIVIARGRVVYTDERSGGKVEADGLDATIRELAYSGAAGTEPLGSISFDGDISCKTLLINNLTATDIAMRISGEKGRHVMTVVGMNIFGGTGQGSLHVDVTGATPRYRVSTALQRLRIEDVVRAASPGKFPPKSIAGAVDISADLTATGKSADEIRRSLGGSLSLKGENLTLYSFDIDTLITKYERSQNFNLVDVGAFFLAGPFGPVITKSYNFESLYQEMQGGTGVIRKIVSIWNVDHGLAEATDVALASKENRLAMKGGLNFINERFVKVTVAVLDKQGCAVYSQNVHGPFRRPQIDKASIFGSVVGSLSNAVKDAWKLVGGKCTVFYSGSVPQPER